MHLPTDYLRDLNEFIDFTIEFNISVKKYKLKDLWIDEIDIDTYDSEVDSFKSLLIDVLNNCDEKSKLLSDVIDAINVACKWYDENNLRSFNSFGQLQRIIVNVSDNSIYNVPERYSVKDVVGESHPEFIFDPFFAYLKVYDVQTNKYKNSEDFEKVKLMYKFSIFINALENIKEYVLMLYKNSTEFKYDFKGFNITAIDQNSRLRCTVNYDKITTANLFNIFLKSGIFYFDKKDANRNDKLMKKFINENFNYTDATLATPKIEKIEKEFSYIDSVSHKVRQQNIMQIMIDELILLKGKL